MVLVLRWRLNNVSDAAQYAKLHSKGLDLSWNNLDYTAMKWFSVPEFFQDPH